MMGGVPMRTVKTRFLAAMLTLILLAPLPVARADDDETEELEQQLEN